MFEFLVSSKRSGFPFKARFVDIKGKKARCLHQGFLAIFGLRSSISMSPQRRWNLNVLWPREAALMA